MPLPDDTAICTRAQIVGCFVPTPTPKPALLFRFVHEDGTEMPPIALVFDETEAQGLHLEIQRAVGAARNVRRMS